VKAFKAPKKFLTHLDANVVATIIAAAADVVMIIDQTGTIRDMAVNDDEFAQGLEKPRKWLGHPWVDTVTQESRSKVEKILSEVAAGAEPRWRHINHVASHGGSVVPVLYCAVRVDKSFLVVFGRDLRSVSALQQQLVDAQQSMERDYSRLRHVETRYRLLFQISSEPVLIVDVASTRIMESNPAAGRLFRAIGRRLVGRPLMTAFNRADAESVQTLLASVRAAGRSDWTRVRLDGSDSEVVVSASLFRQDNATLFLVRLAPTQGDGATPALPATAAMLVKLIEGAPDGFVITDVDGQILMANEAFLEMAQLTGAEQAISESIERWLGRSGVDLSVLISNIRQRGSVSLFATTLRGEHGVLSNVEISATSAVNGDKQCLGFTIRSVGQRVRSNLPAPRELPHSVEQLAGLVGRVSLKELVREATDLIERLAIEAALQLTGDNRASAAEILGLSRQSLYVKLRRYGLATPAVIETDARN
jgi:transcriptional regulator PpsR